MPVMFLNNLKQREPTLFENNAKRDKGKEVNV